MSNKFSIFSLSVALCAAFFCSCQQNATPQKGGVAVGVRNYSDAVVHINQVDPAYRAYFREQNASNYSLSDQRKAYIAAAEVARTPVRESDYRPSPSRKKSVAAKNVRAAKGKNRFVVAAKGKAAPKGKAKGLAKNVGNAKANAAKRAVAVRKPYRKR